MIKETGKTTQEIETAIEQAKAGQFTVKVSPTKKQVFSDTGEQLLSAEVTPAGTWNVVFRVELAFELQRRGIVPTKKGS